MAQINLLTPNTTKPNLGQAVLSIAVKVLFVALILVAVYYGWLLYTDRKTTAQIQDLSNKINEAQAAVIKRTDREELIVRQGQIQALQSLMSNHLYWSKLFPELANATLKTASYVSFSANSDGTATMVVAVPSYVELDKFLQVFDMPEFNKNFSDVKVFSINRSQNGDVIETHAQLQLKYRKELIRPNQGSK